MRFPLEVVVVGKKYSTCRSHIKYVDSVDLKTETDDLDGKSSKIYSVLKKWHWKQSSDVRVMPFLKKAQSVTKWPRNCVSCFMKWPTFIKRSGDHFYNEVTL